MDADLAVIFGFVLTILVIVLPFAYLVNKRQQEHEERKLELLARAAEAKSEEARFGKGDHARMEERIRVLERIATDSNHALASQIDELRALDAVDKKPENAS